MNNPPRSLLRALLRGFRGRCPSCGKGALLSGYIKPERRCAHCDANLEPYQTADIAPYLVTFCAGLIFTPIVVALSLSGRADAWVVSAIMGAALAFALLMLPRAKGTVIGLHWALDVRTDL